MLCDINRLFQVINFLSLFLLYFANYIVKVGIDSIKLILNLFNLNLLLSFWWLISTTFSTSYAQRSAWPLGLMFKLALIFPVKIIYINAINRLIYYWLRTSNIYVFYWLKVLFLDNLVFNRRHIVWIIKPIIIDFIKLTNIR